MAKVEFRDGIQDVPEHVAAILKGIETYQLTYDEAIAQANARMINNHVDRAFSAVRTSHFQAHGEIRR